MSVDSPGEGCCRPAQSSPGPQVGCRKPQTLLIVDPLACIRTPAPYGDAEPTQLIPKLERLLSANTGQAGKAIRALVWRLSVHPSQVLGTLRYTELSIGYLAKAANVSRETARRAWHQVWGALGWTSAPLARVREMGARVRRLAPGAKWGQHLLLPGPVAAAVDAVSESLGLGPVHHGQPTGAAWVVLGPTEARGRYQMATCPWHTDTSPSLMLNRNCDGISGGGVCFACVDDEGSPLRVYWREHEGIKYARHARSVRKVHPTVPRMGTIQNPYVPAQPDLAGARWLLANRDGDGLNRRSSACKGLPALLAVADKMSLRDRSWGKAAAEAQRGGSPQAYASVDPMRPVAWRTINTRRGEVHIPIRWEPLAVQWVLVDLDAFDRAPEDDQGLAIAGEALARWAKGHPLLSGAVCVIRTSHLGVQIVAELEAPRGDPRGWYRTGEAKGLCAELDRAALTAVRGVGFAGGHADQAVHAAGRLMRRPGWRVDKAGDLYRSRLVQPGNRSDR